MSRRHILNFSVALYFVLLSTLGFAQEQQPDHFQSTSTALRSAEDVQSIVEVFKRLPALNQSTYDAGDWQLKAYIPLWVGELGDIEDVGFKEHHPQGIKVVQTIEGDTKLLMSTRGEAIDSKFGKRAFLVSYAIDLEEQTAEFENHACYHKGSRHSGGRMDHLGGIDGDGEHLYAPLAESKNQGITLVYSAPCQGPVTNRTAGERCVAQLPTHCGTVICDTDQNCLYVMSWGSKKAYTVSLACEELIKLPDDTPAFEAKTGWEYQDCKYIGDGYAICSGYKKSGLIFKTKTPEVHLIRFDWEKATPIINDDLPQINGQPTALTIPFTIVHRLAMPKLEPTLDSNGDPQFGDGTILTNNPLDFEVIFENEEVVGLRLYFAPHDNQDTHLFVFDAVL